MPRRPSTHHRRTDTLNAPAVLFHAACACLATLDAEAKGGDHSRDGGRDAKRRAAADKFISYAAPAAPAAVAVAETLAAARAVAPGTQAASKTVVAAHGVAVVGAAAATAAAAAAAATAATAAAVAAVNPFPCAPGAPAMMNYYPVLHGAPAMPANTAQWHPVQMLSGPHPPQ